MTQVQTIDPAPRATLSDYTAVEVHRSLLADIPGEFWDRVQPGDVISLDGSHILMPGTDVDYLLTEIMPRVAGKAVFHIHDILLPDAYPDTWAWRGYNEQSAIAGLIASGAYEVLWSSHYVRTRLNNRLADAGLSELPLNPGAIETSLWLSPSKKHHV